MRSTSARADAGYYSHSGGNADGNWAGGKGCMVKGDRIYTGKTGKVATGGKGKGKFVIGRARVTQNQGSILDTVHANMVAGGAYAGPYSAGVPTQVARPSTAPDHELALAIRPTSIREARRKAGLPTPPDFVPGLTQPRPPPVQQIGSKARPLMPKARPKAPPRRSDSSETVLMRHQHVCTWPDDAVWGTDDDSTDPDRADGGDGGDEGDVEQPNSMLEHDINDAQSEHANSGDEGDEQHDDPVIDDIFRRGPNRPQMPAGTANSARNREFRFTKRRGGAKEQQARALISRQPCFAVALARFWECRDDELTPSDWENMTRVYGPKELRAMMVLRTQQT